MLTTTHGNAGSKNSRQVCTYKEPFGNIGGGRALNSGTNPKQLTSLMSPPSPPSPHQPLNNSLLSDLNYSFFLHPKRLAPTSYICSLSLRKRRIGGFIVTKISIGTERIITRSGGRPKLCLTSSFLLEW